MTISEYKYQHHILRALERGGVRWWVVSDISDALGFSKTGAVSRSIAERDLDMYMTGKSGNRRHLIATEAGLINALAKSRMPATDGFLRWLAMIAPCPQLAAQVSVEPRGLHARPTQHTMALTQADAPAWLEQVMGTLAQGMAILSGTAAQNRTAVEGLACEVADTRNWVEAIEDEGRRNAADQRAEIARLSNTVAQLADKERCQAIRNEVDNIKDQVTAAMCERGATQSQANSAFWRGVKRTAGVASVAPKDLTPALAQDVLDAARNEARLYGVSIKQLAPNPPNLSLWAVGK